MGLKNEPIIRLITHLLAPNMPQMGQIYGGSKTYSDPLPPLIKIFPKTNNSYPNMTLIFFCTAVCFEATVLKICFPTGFGEQQIKLIQQWIDQSFFVNVLSWFCRPYDFSRAMYITSKMRNLYYFEGEIMKSRIPIQFV